MRTESLSDHQLVERIRRTHSPRQALVDEYYRRCIRVYLEFIGVHWHTGFYLDDGRAPQPADQQRMNRHIADSVRLSSHDVVLDVGCGIGGTTCDLARTYQARIHGLTPVAAQRDLAASVALRAGVGDLVRFELGHAGALPYPDHSFDVVLFFESPCHFPDRPQFFSEVFRVLRPGGRLAGEDWLTTGQGTDEDIRRWIEPISRSWAMPRLADGAAYLRHMQDAGFVDCRYVDMRTEMRIEKGFSVTERQQAELDAEQRDCPDPLLKLTLEGLLCLGRALSAGMFTIGRFTARKPEPVVPDA